ncbi:hypothetical protein IQ06DRAFT_267882 [Phaeosphaeriaceae sp. SRC1lsM3a]|nr:hypothetical protein IQ06DRAFT_267882 [Stagonospora sp. SRC1lsM3a]
MTQTGKCDTCRQRKVKCDEEKPKCGACRKKDRPCSYSYGKASAFIVQDPNQLTKHGKSRVSPVVYNLESSSEATHSPASTPSDLHITTAREAGNGQGFFQTLAPLSKRKVAASRRSEAQRRRKLELYLHHLQLERTLTAIKPSCPETTLIARYIDMVGSVSIDHQPLSILGTWIESIPSRIGSNRMMDLAVDFFVHSYAVYCNDTYSQRKLASASKEKALKELQLFVHDRGNRPTYDVVLATKMHYASEALLGIDTMYHAIHAYGLAELLKSGFVSDVDDEHFWNLIDNTYIDDVNEAMLAGRNSTYDNEFYLSSTLPPPFESDTIVLSASQRASMAMMHVYIQFPRLNNLIRHAVTHQEDTTTLAAAVTLTESLWQLNVPKHVAPLLSEVVSISPRPVEGLTDIMADSLHFASVQAMVSCTRYWMLMIVLGGFVDTLHRHFPSQTSLSLLPNRDLMQEIEMDAANQLAKSMPWADSLSQKLPLVPLRLHTPLQVSIGAWYRSIRRLGSKQPSNTDLDPVSSMEMDQEMAHARLMIDWIIEECNQIHRRWDVSMVDETPLFEALDAMAGEKIPSWLPVRVSFEAEDGELVMSLAYQNADGTYDDSYDLTDNPPKSIIDSHTNEWRKSAGLPHFDISPKDPDGARKKVNQYPKLEPRELANLVHRTGRNLCSTSGWWPKFGEEGSATLMDSTHKISAFSNMPRPEQSDVEEISEGYVDPHPCFTSSFLPQMPNSLSSSVRTTPRNPCLSPAWSSPMSRTPANSDDTIRDDRCTPISEVTDLTEPSTSTPDNPDRGKGVRQDFW